MNIVHTLIIRHCRNQLLARGWPDNMQIEANPRYCQGDGVAFYGELDVCMLVEKLPVFVARGFLTSQQAFDLKPLIVRIGHTAILYRDPNGSEKVSAETVLLKYRTDPSMLEEPLLKVLQKALRREIRDICGRVAADGYRLCDALNCSHEPVVFQRQTANLTLIVTETNHFESYEHKWDTAKQDECIEAILFQNALFRTLEISVSYKERNQMLGQHLVLNVKRFPAQPVREWFDRKWLREAVDNARQDIKETLAKLNSFLSAA